MANIKKEELLAVVKNFEQINSRIEKRQNMDLEALAVCQSQAEDLGNYIEFSYKEIDTDEIINALEEYCECLYQLSIPENDTEIRRIAKRIRKLLISVDNDIKYQLPDDKKIIVFLPYKASMWDSLESIYLAAREDDTCEAYVIPIPYFDKKSDGSFGRMHYEGNEFPENIPITSWQEYSIKESKPNVIYIHNPYDNWNTVTSVHPMFYSSELVKYTNELVYVPYFVLQEIEPENQNAIARMKHFITTPGVVCADKVFVQSEKMKQIYVKEYISWAKEHGLRGKHVDRKYQEHRIQGTGSPKFDKVLDAKKTDFVIPKEWKRKIEDKKIILFNSSISAALNNGDDYMDKLEKIFALLKEREDFILWWRPHPMLLLTLDSMRHDLSKRYKRIVKEYKSENYGIYDDSADLNRAIAYSDRYYGDPSSVLQLYGATGKPALISVIKKRSRDKKEVDNWRTCDYEENDLIDWLMGKEKWVIKETFREMYKDLNLQGENGNKIHRICTEEL